MSPIDLATLTADTEAQLDAALSATGTGEFLDLQDLLPRIDQLCAEALAQGGRPAAEQLARILAKLDRLQAALREQIVRLGAEMRPDPKRAAETYRAAANPRPDERE